MAKRRRVEGDEQQQGSEEPEQQPADDSEEGQSQSEDGDDQLAFNQLSGELLSPLSSPPLTSLRCTLTLLLCVQHLPQCTASPNNAPLASCAYATSQQHMCSSGSLAPSVHV